MIFEIATLGVGVCAVNAFQMKERYHRTRYASAKEFKAQESARLEYAAFHYKQWWKAMCYRRGAAAVATAGALGTTWRTLQLAGLLH